MYMLVSYTQKDEFDRKSVEDSLGQIYLLRALIHQTNTLFC